MSLGRHSNDIAFKPSVTSEFEYFHIWTQRVEETLKARMLTFSYALKTRTFGLTSCDILARRPVKIKHLEITKSQFIDVHKLCEVK
jgi:hypothetical protein